MVSAMTWTSSSRSTGGDPADEFANSASYAGPAKKTLYIEAIDDRRCSDFYLGMPSALSAS
jgi:hypothetical protein